MTEPDRCPRCGSDDRGTCKLMDDGTFCDAPSLHPWHSTPAPQQDHSNDITVHGYPAQQENEDVETVRQQLALGCEAIHDRHGFQSDAAHDCHAPEADRALDRLTQQLATTRRERDEARGEAILVPSLLKSAEQLKDALQRIEQLEAALRGLVTAVPDVAGNLASRSTWEEEVQAALDNAVRALSQGDQDAKPS